MATLRRVKVAVRCRTWRPGRRHGRRRRRELHGCRGADFLVGGAWLAGTRHRRPAGDCGAGLGQGCGLQPGASMGFGGQLVRGGVVSTTWLQSDRGSSEGPPARIRDVKASLATRADHATIGDVDFDLSTEQQAIRDTCRDFAREVVAPAAEGLDRDHAFGYDVVRQMGELGLFGLPFPEEYGGAGGDFLSYCLAIEEISRGDVSVGITMEAHTSLGATPFYLFGSSEQKEQFLVPLARGEQLWAFGLTEPGAGSDSGGAQTHAVL